MMRNLAVVLICIGTLMPTLYVRGASANPDYHPAELVQHNFSSWTGSVPSSSLVLMEFYAHWCPHCQHFKPEYERVAHFLALANKVPQVVVAQVDCANEGHLCSEFHVRSYPTLRIGLPESFAATDVGALRDVTLKKKDAKSVIAWLEGHLNITYDSQLWDQAPLILADGDPRKTAVPINAVPAPEPDHFDLHDIEVSTALAFKYIWDSDALLEGADSRQALEEFVNLLAVAHPSPRCRQGSQKLKKEFSELWPARSEPDPELREVEICAGVSPVEGKWHSCKGSKDTSRGFTCGMWQLFHALSVRVPERGGGALWVAGVTGYVGHFFQCRACSEHFMNMVKTSNAGAVKSRRDAVMWMWEAHNKVNKRLSRDELQWGDKDPLYPKVQFPSLQLCPGCHAHTQEAAASTPAWHREGVYNFLLQYYGDKAADQHDRDASRTGLESKGSALWNQYLTICFVLLIVLLVIAYGPRRFKSGMPKAHSLTRALSRALSKSPSKAHSLPIWKSLSLPDDPKAA